jgi:UPF0755 protein
MQLHHHFPTFIHVPAKVTAWYGRRDLFERILMQLGVVLAVGYTIYAVFLAAPAVFPSGTFVTVPKGTSLHEITEDFYSKGIVRSPFLLKAGTKLLGDDTKLPAGVYYFAQPQSLLTVAIRLATGDFNTTPVRIRVAEGSTVDDIAQTLTQRLPSFDRREFLAAAQTKEGYLFPDTYFFMPGDSTEAILSVFSNSLHTNLASIQKEIDEFGKPLPEVLTMASLLEKEAPTLESRRVIAGILWNRIKRGMPLQVDATFPYYLNRNTFEVTLDDLRDDHPYNTYTNKGLPPGPIANPSLSSILAAVTPISTNYLYYLSDLDGNFHYCATYECHLANKRKYLD